MPKAMSVRRIVAGGTATLTAAAVVSLLSSSAAMAATPDTPTDATATVTNDTTVSLGWTEPATGPTPDSHVVYVYSPAAGPGMISTYTEVSGTGFASPQSTCDDGVPPNPCAVAGLEAGRKYYFKVSAVNNTDEGAKSEAASVTAGTPGPIPGTPTVAVMGDKTLEVTYALPTGGADPNGFQIEASDGAAAFEVVADTPCETPADTCRDVADLVAGDSYTFRVTPQNNNGDGPVSAVSDAAVAITGPAAPDQPVATVNGDQSASVSWTAVTGTAAMPVDSYLVQYSSDDGATWHPAANGTCSDTPVLASPCTVTLLTPGDSYIFQVRAVNRANADPAWSSSSEAVTAISAPTITAAAIPAAVGSVLLSITKPLGASPDSYKVYSDPAIDGPYTEVDPADLVLDLDSDPPTATVSHLTTGTTEYFKVAATYTSPDSVGDKSAAVAFTPIDYPMAPDKPVVTSTGDRELTVGWTAVATAGRPIDGYMVTASSGGGVYNEVTLGECHKPTASPCKVTNLSLGGSYQFIVTAINDLGSTASAASDPTTVTDGSNVTPPTTAVDSPLDSDALDELAYVGADGTVWAWHNVTGLTGPGIPYTGAKVAVGHGFEPARTRFADIDGDGKKEIVYIAPDGRVWAFHNGTADAAGMPFNEAGYVIGWGFDPARTNFADLNGDGKAEITYTDDAGTVWAWDNMDGSLTSSPYTAAKVAVGFGFEPARVRFADLDKDNKAEIENVSADGSVWAWHNTLAAGAFTTFPYPDAATKIAVGFDPSRTLFADVDGDGQAEIAYVYDDGSIRAWKNVGGLVTMPYTASPMLVGVGFETSRALFSPTD